MVLQFAQCGLGGCNIGWVDERSYTNSLGHQVTQEPQPLGYHLPVEKIDASRIAAGSGEAGDKTKMDRVFADTEDDRDRRCSSFGGKRGRVTGRGDHGHSTAHQIAIPLALGIADYGYVLQTGRVALEGPVFGK